MTTSYDYYFANIRKEGEKFFENYGPEEHMSLKESILRETSEQGSEGALNALQLKVLEVLTSFAKMILFGWLTEVNISAPAKIENEYFVSVEFKLRNREKSNFARIYLVERWQNTFYAQAIVAEIPTHPETQVFKLLVHDKGSDEFTFRALEHTDRKWSF